MRPFLSVLLFLSAGFVSAGDADSPAQTLTKAGLSSLPLAVHSVLLEFHNLNDNPPFSGLSGYDALNESTLLLMPLPLYLDDTPKALAFSAAGLGLWGTAAAVQAARGPDLFRNVLFQVSWKLNMESTYEVYRDSRLNSADPGYRPFPHWSFSEIALAPFTPSAILNPVNLAIVPLYALGAAAGNWDRAKTDSVFATGRTFFNDTELSPWLAVPVSLSVGAAIAVQNSFEEAYWRGFVYEELKYGFQKSTGTWNWVPASVLSSGLFALWHVPILGWEWNQVGVFVLGFVIDAIYETGGLPAAGAGHGWANASAFLLGWVMTSGVPQHLPKTVKLSPVTLGPSPHGLLLSVSLPDLLGVRL